ncbi:MULTISPECIES: hypothetical protein [Bifidobacterium]|uniref:hypothetical protein n=1 Tax=Bifidobacterium TaxID=1678 RepID=UPI0013D2733A|nr:MULTISPECIES: hypothetical protein [Bifidobacterium]
MATYHAGEDNRRSHRGARRPAAPWNPLCAVAGILTVLAGLAVAIRGVAPQMVPVVKDQTLTTWTIIAGVLAVLTLVLVIVARVTAPAGHRRSAASSWGILAIVLALLMMCAGLVTSNLFSEGVVKPEVRDEAPISNTEEMQSGVEGVFGACTTKWQSVNASQYPGVKAIYLCKQTRVAYAIFDNSSAIGLYKAPLATQASKLLDQYSGEVGSTKYAMLIGKQWILVGEQSKIEKLQHSWGGTINTIE